MCCLPFPKRYRRLRALAEGVPSQMQPKKPLARARWGHDPPRKPADGSPQVPAKESPQSGWNEKGYQLDQNYPTTQPTELIHNIGKLDSYVRGSASARLVINAKLKILEDRAALVEVWWLSPGPFRAADRFPLGNSANLPFGFPRSDTNRNHGEFFLRPQFP